MSLLYECVNTVIAGENWNLEPRKKNQKRDELCYHLTPSVNLFFFNLMYSKMQ